MVEIIEGYAMVIGSWINFLFELNFGDGTTVGGILLAVCALSLIIRFIFRPTWSGTVNSDVMANRRSMREIGRAEAALDKYVN